MSNIPFYIYWDIMKVVMKSVNWIKGTSINHVDNKGRGLKISRSLTEKPIFSNLTDSITIYIKGYLMADLTEKQLQLKEETARCILNVANKVIPGKYVDVRIHK